MKTVYVNTDTFDVSMTAYNAGNSGWQSFGWGQ